MVEVHTYQFQRQHLGYSAERVREGLLGALEKLLAP
jgi:hypothetical protein